MTPLVARKKLQSRSKYGKKRAGFRKSPAIYVTTPATHSKTPAKRHPPQVLNEQPSRAPCPPPFPATKGIPIDLIDQLGPGEVKEKFMSAVFKYEDEVRTGFRSTNALPVPRAVQIKASHAPRRDWEIDFVVDQKGLRLVSTTQSQRRMCGARSDWKYHWTDCREDADVFEMEV